MAANDAPGTVLAPAQWRLVSELSEALAPAQAQWLSGYFAGLAAGSSSAGAPTAGTAGARRITILYGTETGNAAELARTFEAAARDRGLAPTLFDMADYKVRQLGQEEDLLIVVSTYGEGDPPQPATGFFEFIEGRRGPPLQRLRFAVLALGDSTYEYFCEAGKRLDRRLDELGARRLLDRVDCDIDYEEAAAAWTATVVDRLASDGPAVPATAITAAGGFAPVAAHDKRNPFPAAIIENIAIVGRGSSKETRHVEFSLAGSSLAYQPGDALGIAATNDPAVVADLLDALALSPDASFELKGQKLSLGEALTHRFEITLATPRFLEYWAMLSDCSVLKQLREEDRSGERSVFLRTHHIVDIVRRFPVVGVMPQGFVSALRPLQPRLYSIASSLAAAPDEAHLTVAPVRYLRVTIIEGLLDRIAGAVPSADDAKLMKFHGIYQQDDRDRRDERRRQMLEPAFQFMIRVCLPGGVCTPAQWLRGSIVWYAKTWAKR